MYTPVKPSVESMKKQVDSEEYPRGFMTTVGYLDPALITALKTFLLDPKTPRSLFRTHRQNTSKVIIQTLINGSLKSG
jgi:hypothetical protein